MNNIDPNIRIAMISLGSDFIVFSREPCFNLRDINITLEDIKIYLHRIRISALLSFITILCNIYNCFVTKSRPR